MFARKAGLVVQAAAERGKTLATLPAANIRRVGFSDQEALLPPSPRSFERYRLVREYFAFPQRYLFFEVPGFAEAVKRCAGDSLDLVIALKEQDTRPEGRLDQSFFEPFCTPAIHLISK